jgi:O-methyltransferase
MTTSLRRTLGRVLPRKLNARLRSLAETLLYPPDLTEADRALYESVAPYTMTSVERVVTLANYVRSVVTRGVPGDLVECGVWRGGSAMCMAQTLLSCGADDRHLYLFDTFDGMTNPTEVDVSVHGARARDLFAGESQMLSGGSSKKGGLSDVRRNLENTGYPEQNLHFVQGRVEQTIPTAAPQAIALLRLDTDWYESTLHELRHLYDRVSTGGIVIIDDYGHWSGCRKAVDEFLATLEPGPVLHRIDYTCRSFVKP